MFNRLVIAAVAVVFALASCDAWKVTGRVGTSVAIAVIPTLILTVSFFVSAFVGRRTGRRLLLRFAASSMLVLGVVAYGSYAFTGPGGSGSASHMHVVFFPVVLGVLALLVVGGYAAAAYVWPLESANASQRPREG